MVIEPCIDLEKAFSAILFIEERVNFKELANEAEEEGVARPSPRAPGDTFEEDNCFCLALNAEALPLLASLPFLTAAVTPTAERSCATNVVDVVVALGCLLPWPFFPGDFLIVRFLLFAGCVPISIRVPVATSSPVAWFASSSSSRTAPAFEAVLSSTVDRWTKT